MINRFLVLQSRFFLVLFLLSVFLGGCVFPPTITPPATCAAELEQANIYRNARLEIANGIYEAAYPATPVPLPTYTPDPVNTPLPGPPIIPTNTPFPGQIDSARYAAFQYLIKQTRRWTDIETIKFKDGGSVEIAVTFVSPELLQAVFLNNSLDDGVQVLDFQSQAQAALDSIAGRQEALFLLTIVSPLNNMAVNNHVLKIDTTTLKLKNAEGLELKPGHIDSNLGELINSSSEAVFGYFGYPLVETESGACKWALDPKYNTNIVVSLPAINVDGADVGPFSWTVAYAPLMDLAVSPSAPDLNMPQGYNLSQIALLQTPPNGIQQTNRWQDFARFLWYKVTLGN